MEPNISVENWKWCLTELEESHNIYIYLNIYCAKHVASYPRRHEAAITLLLLHYFPISNLLINMHFSSILIFHYSLHCTDLVLLWKLVVNMCALIKSVTTKGREVTVPSSMKTNSKRVPLKPVSNKMKENHYLGIGTDEAQTARPH